MIRIQILIILPCIVSLSVNGQPTYGDIYGIDVHKNTITSWEAVADDGIDFAYIKATESDYTPYVTFQTNAPAAKAEGIKVGAYHFGTPLFSQGYWQPDYNSQTTAVQEASHFVQAAQDYIVDCNLPPALDIEDQIVYKSPTHGYIFVNILTGRRYYRVVSGGVTTEIPFGQAPVHMDAATLAQWIRDWSDEVYRLTNVMPVLYCNISYANALYQYYPGIIKNRLWIAQYYPPPNQPNNSGWLNWDWDFHQYSDRGHVIGITGNVDLDVFHGTWTDFTTLINQSCTNATLLPDLKITSGTQSVSPTTVAAGSNITASASEDNSGSGNAGANAVTLWLSSDATLNSNDVLLGQINFPSLAANANSNVFSNSVQIPSNTASGNYTLFFWADGNQAVTELYENNNVASVQITVTGTTTSNDNCLNAYPLNAANGYCLTNQTVQGATPSGLGANNCCTICGGCTDCCDGTTTGYCGASLTDYDVFFSFQATKSTHTVTVSNLNFDAVLEFRSGCNIGCGNLIGCCDPSGTPSTITKIYNYFTPGMTYYVRIFKYTSTANYTPPAIPTFDICVDGQSTLPNLTRVSGASSLSVNGNNVNLSIQVVNNGGSSAGSSTVCYYLSSDASFTSSDYLIGTSSVSSLSRNATSSESINVDVCTVSPPVPNGTYYIGYIIDCGEDVTESEEGDNGWYFPDPNYQITVNCIPSIGCDNCDTKYPTSTQSTVSSTATTISTCVYGGEYSNYSVTDGETYTWTTCNGSGWDTQLTLFQGSNCGGNALKYNDDDCGLLSTLTWTADFSGTVTLLVSEYDCQSNSDCMTLEWACTSCACSPPSAPVATFGSSTCPGTATTTTPSLTWNDVPGAQGYYVAVSEYPYESGNIITSTSCDAGTPYTIPSGVLEPGMLYRWNMTANSSSGCSDNSCESSFSNTFYFHIPPAITANGSTSFCQGGSVSLSLSPNPSPGSGASKSYQWYKDGSPVGTNSSSYNATQSGNYTVAISYSGSTVTSCTGTVSTSQSNGISVAVTNCNTTCIQHHTLIASPPPINGTYPLGTSVTFTYTISDFQQVKDNYLHGIVPQFGSGWDVSTLSNQISPQKCDTTCPDYEGFWAWYDHVITGENQQGISGGPGFFYESCLGCISCDFTNPGDNYGDGGIGPDCSLSFQWTITTKNSCVGGQTESLNIEIFNYSDSETGNWDSLGCQNDPNYIFYASLSCNPNSVAIDGYITSEMGEPINTVTVDATTSGNPQSMTTSSNGFYTFNVPVGNCTITPSKNNDQITNNGISTQDIILIRRHLLGIQPLNTPYKVIAADVNSSNSVTTTDILFIRSMILQITTTFPSGKLWTFVPDDYTFANQQNPFPFPNNRTYQNLNASYSDENFIGIKLGDVNDSWDPNTPKAWAVAVVGIAIGEYHVMTGDEIVVPLKVRDFTKIMGYQFTLSWNATVLSFLEVSNKALQGYYGDQRKQEGFLTTAWYDEAIRARTLNNGETAFELKFKVVGGAGAQTPIKIGSELTASEAYNANLDLLNIVPINGMVKVEAYDQDILSGDCCELKVVPNPFTSKTNIIFSIPKDETVSIEIYDLLGKQIRKVEANYKAGEHFIEWAGDDEYGNQVSPGLYQVRMVAGIHRVGAKVVLIR